MAQIEDAVKIAEVKYPREKGYRLAFIFDHSSCHGAYADDALNAYKMNNNEQYYLVWQRIFFSV